MHDDDLKAQVAEFWERASCGEVYAQGENLRERLDAHARARYAVEPFIFDFAAFGTGRGRDVLEIGVGMGADHLEWAKAGPRSLTGVDLTPRAVEFTRARLELNDFQPKVFVADAERLPFPDAQFDVVYSWGVLHHSPDTPRAIAEVWRVLRPGGTARIMIYHSRSIVGFLLWGRYALMKGRPWRSLRELYATYLESPGTKAYSVGEAKSLFSAFSSSKAQIQLSCGDLLEAGAGQRHGGVALQGLRSIWPRPLIRRLLPRCGLFLLIEAVK